MLPYRFRHLLIAILGGAALSAALLLALWALPARAQAAPDLSAAPFPLLSRSDVELFAPTGVTTTYVYLPLVALFLTPCSAAPLLVTPTDQTLLDNLIPGLTYLRRTTVVSSSDLDLAINPGFNPLAATLAAAAGGPVSVTAHPLDNLQQATLYYWRVRDNCQSSPGPYSPVFSFTTGSGGVVLPAPALISPTNGTAGVGSQVTLSWTAVLSSTGYLVWVLRPNGSANVTFNGATSKTLTSLVAGATYTWYVEAANEYAYGMASEHWTFTAGPLRDLPAGAAAAQPMQGDGALNY